MTDLSLKDTEARRSGRSHVALDARIPHPLEALSALARFTGVSELMRLIQRRRRFLRLLSYDDRALDDIGLIRYDIERAAKLPLRVNAAEEAHRLAAAERPRRRGIRRR